MITKIQANKENNHVRRIATYTPPMTTYIGLSTADEFSDSGNVPANSEPSSEINYSRIAVTNDSTTWNESVDGEITNKIELKFDELNGSASGIVKWVFESETIDGTDDVMYYAKLEPEITLAEYLTIKFNPNDIKFTRTNPTDTSNNS